MKVCIVTPRYPPIVKGGGEISVSLLARELSKFVEVNVVSFDRNLTSVSVVDDIPVTRVHPIAPHDLKLPQNLQALRILREKIGTCDIFHSYNHDLMPSLGFLTKKHGINSVATLNGSVYFHSLDTGGHFKSGNPVRRAAISLIKLRNKFALHYIENIKMFTTLSTFYRDKFAEAGIPKDKIRIVTNMLDPNFKPKQNIKAKAKVIILYTGSYIFSRGIDILIDAYSRLEEQNVELIIAGDSPQKIQPLIKKFEPKNDVNVVGKISYDKLPDLYALADIYVLPYRYPYPVGRTILEAMVSGVPTITTGNSYYSPIIEDMKSGVLIYPMEAEKLAEVIQRLIDSPNLRKRLSHNAKKRVRDVCSPHKISRKYLEIYERLISSDT